MDAELVSRRAGAGMREVRYTSRDGLALAAHDYGDPGSPWTPVVCLPGLTRTSRDFRALAIYLAAHRERPRRVIAFDYRGRGGSEWDKDPANYNVVTELGDILDGMTAVGLSRVAVIGTSRGGIIGMLMAFSRPQTVVALALNDIGPFIEPRGLVRLKSYVGRTPKPEDWQDAARIQRRLHGAQFTAFDDHDWLQFARLTYRDGGGSPESDHDPNLAATLALVEIDQPAPAMWDEFGALRPTPLLVIRGANSDVLSEATLQRMTSEHGRLEAITVPDEGHAPLLRGGALLGRIASFIAAAEDGAFAAPPPELAAAAAD
jgi:pimeloyl-ACP methyl ester carboxylesterase